MNSKDSYFCAGSGPLQLGVVHVTFIDYVLLSILYSSDCSVPEFPCFAVFIFLWLKTFIHFIHNSPLVIILLFYCIEEQGFCGVFCFRFWY